MVTSPLCFAVELRNEAILVLTGVQNTIAQRLYHCFEVLNEALRFVLVSRFAEKTS